MALLYGSLQCECDRTLAFLFDVNRATRHLFVLQFRLLFSFFFDDSHLTHKLLFLLLQQFFLPFTVNIVIAAVFNLDEVVNALGVFELSLVNPSPLDGLFEPLTHVLELKVRARIGTGVLAVRVVIEVDALVVHQIRGRIPLFWNRVMAKRAYLVFCLLSFFWKP